MSSLEGVTESVNIETLRGGKVDYKYEGGVLTINLDVLQDYEALVLS